MGVTSNWPNKQTTKKNTTEGIFFTSSSSLGCSTERSHTLLRGLFSSECLSSSVRLRLGGLATPIQIPLSSFHHIVLSWIQGHRTIENCWIQTDEFFFSQNQQVGETTGCHPAAPGCGRTTDLFLYGSRHQTEPLKPGSTTSPASSARCWNVLLFENN